MRRAVFGDQRGLALPLTLAIGLLLTSLTLAMLALATVEPTIARHHRDGTQARFAAEAGVEWAFNSVAGTADWNTLLVGAAADGVVLTNASPLPGKTAAFGGTYTVQLRNDTLAADPAITGVAATDVDPAIDANAALIVTSTGQVGTATRVVQAAIRRAVLPPFPAALAFPGNEAEVSFSGNSFEIDGRGYNTDGTLDAGCSPVLGIAVSPVLPANDPGANEAVVEDGLASQQKDNVQGKPEDASQAGEGDNTVDVDPNLTPDAIKKFIDQAKQGADIVLESKQPSGLSFNNVGASCDSDPNGTTCWGTASEPKIVYVKGDPDPTSSFSALQVSGNTTGHGILIVEDGDFRISGNFNWNGVIIVTGQWVGIGFLGGGNQAVYGAVVSNEMAVDPGFREGVVTGNAKVRYSCQALNAVSSLRKLTTVSNWQELAQ